MKTFFLGTHEVSWLARTAAPLCVSHHRLRRQKRLPRARGPWLLDSGSFTSLHTDGHHQTPPDEYADAVHRYVDTIGEPAAAAIQDWMCEPDILARTGLSVPHHQAYTVQNYVTLSHEAPDIPWMPVLQGWTVDDYLRCAELYDATGLPWRDELVGVGSICRRQATYQVLEILRALHPQGLQLHAFGMKTLGLQLAAHLVTSSDSLAWSYHARKRQPLPGHTHKSCSNCLEYALKWRDTITGRPYQELLTA